MLNLSDPSLLVSSAYINGVWVDAGLRTPVRNPADGQVVAEVADVGVAGARAAIEAAERAQRDYELVPLEQDGRAVARRTRGPLYPDTCSLSSSRCPAFRRLLR